MRARGGLVLAASALTLALWGCHAVLGLREPEGSDPLPYIADASAETGTTSIDGGALPPDPCASKELPAKPAVDDDPLGG